MVGRDGTPHMSSIANDSSWRIWERPGKKPMLTRDNKTLSD